MSVVAAFVDGWRRVARARSLVAGVWLATLAATLPAAYALRTMIAAHLGASAVAGAVASGVDYDWWNEFLAQATGIGQTFTPAILGFSATLANLDGVLDGDLIPRPLVPAVAVYLGLSIFLMGGIVDRLARDRRVGSAGFFASCGVFFLRLVRLGALAALVYGVLFLWLHPWLFDSVYPAWTRDVTVERTAAAYRLLLYIVFAATLAAVNIVVDYAKIRMVVEDRRSALGALAASLRFVRRQPGAAAGLYLLNTLAFVAVIAAYYLLAPWAGGGMLAALLAFAVAQLYILARVAVRLAFVASQTALFQGRLAHAGYVARPTTKWPESAAAEAISAAD